MVSLALADFAGVIGSGDGIAQCRHLGRRAECYYPGIGAGAEGAGGLTVSVSNAKTICNIGGPFVNGSFGAGAGPDISGDLFFGPSPNGQVAGGGLTFGAGAGVGASEGVTYTVVQPLVRLW